MQYMGVANLIQNTQNQYAKFYISILNQAYSELSNNPLAVFNFYNAFQYGAETPDDFYVKGGFYAIIPYIDPSEDFTIFKYSIEIVIYIISSVSFDDNSFLTPQFFDNIMNAVFSQKETTSLLGLTLLRSLLKNQSISSQVFNILQTEIGFIQRLIESNYLNITRHPALVSSLLFAFIKFYSVDELVVFLPFLPNVLHSISIEIEKIPERDKNSLISTKKKMLRLLSTLLQNPEIRSESYKLDCLNLLLFAIDHPPYYLKSSHKEIPIFSYSYDCVYQIVVNDGIPEAFKSLAFYNLTQNVLQKVNKYQLHSVIDAINILYINDWFNLWENDIVSEILDKLNFGMFEEKEVALSSLLKFIRVAAFNQRIIVELVNNKFLEFACAIVDSIQNDEIKEFLNVINLLYGMDGEVRELILRDELKSVLESLAQSDDEEINACSEELLNAFEQN